MTGEGSPESRFLFRSEADPASEVSTSSFRGGQTFSREQGEHEIKAEDAAHFRWKERVQLETDLREKQKDNDLRRLCFQVFVGIVVVALVAAFLVGFVNDDPNTRQWGQGISTTLIGGLIGAIAGYFTGRSGN